MLQFFLVFFSILMLFGCDTDSTPKPKIYQLESISFDGSTPNLFQHDENGRFLYSQGIWSDDKSFEGIDGSLDIAFTIDNNGYYSQFQAQRPDEPLETLNYTSSYQDGRLQSVGVVSDIGDSMFINFEYDASGRLTVKRIEEDNEIIEHRITYDDIGQIEKIESWEPDFNSVPTLIETQKFTYDPQSLIVMITSRFLGGSTDFRKIYRYKESEKCVPLPQYFFDEYLTNCGSIF